MPNFKVFDNFQPYICCLGTTFILVPTIQKKTLFGKSNIGIPYSYYRASKPNEPNKMMSGFYYYAYMFSYV
jgi:hypothetical protein